MSHCEATRKPRTNYYYYNYIYYTINCFAIVKFPGVARKADSWRDCSDNIFFFFTYETQSSIVLLLTIIYYFYSNLFTVSIKILERTTRIRGSLHRDGSNIKILFLHRSLCPCIFFPSKITAGSNNPAVF